MSTELLERPNILAVGMPPGKPEDPSGGGGDDVEEDDEEEDDATPTT
jgi:hypothetical protein